MSKDNVGIVTSLLAVTRRP